MYLKKVPVVTTFWERYLVWTVIMEYKPCVKAVIEEEGCPSTWLEINTQVR